MNISLVDIESTSIKQDGLSCVSLSLCLQPLSRTQESFILEKLHTQSRLGKSRSLFCRKDKVIPQPQLVDDAIAGNVSPVMACTDDSGCKKV